MQLILLRHGIAVDRSAGLADHERALTEVGARKTRRAIAGLAQMIDKPQVIVTSPALRASQTADIAADVFCVRVETRDTLLDGTAHQIIEVLGHLNEDCVLAVGHEPTFSEVIEVLCFGRTTSSVELKKAGCACVKVPPNLAAGSGCLQWLATPKMLRRLGK